VAYFFAPLLTYIASMSNHIRIDIDAYERKQRKPVVKARRGRVDCVEKVLSAVGPIF
jgi:hypothetical protein